MAEFFDPAIFTVSANVTQAIAAFQEVGTELGVVQAKAEQAGGSISSLEKSSLIAKAALVGLATAAVGFGKFAIDSATQTQTAFARLDTALKNAGAGGAAASKQMQDLAENSTNLGFKVTDTANALGTLVTATHNTQDSQQILTLAMNVARQQHISLADAATQLASATQGRLGAAFRQAGIVLDTTLPKQQAINKAFDELGQRTSGQNAAYLQTFAGQMSVLGANAEKLAAKVGDVLIPVIQDIIGFFKTFGNEILIVGGTILTAMAAFKAYEIAMNAFKAVQIIYIAVTSGMAAAQTALIFATEGGEVATKSMAVAQAALNAVMDANPVMLIVTGIGLLVAAFIVAWNHSEAFRKIMIDVGKAGIEAVGWLIGIVGDLVVAWMKVITGPMKLMLEGLSHLPFVGGAAKAALKDIGTATNDVSSFFSGAKKTVDSYSSSLDSLANKKITIPGLGGSGSASSASTNDSVYSLDNYSGANTGAAKAAAAATKRADAIKKANDQIISLQDQMAKDLADRQSQMETAMADKNTRDLDAQTKFQQTSTDIQTAFLDAKQKAQETYDTTVADLRQKAADQALALEQQAADKRSQIIQQSIGVLTTAWANATATDAGKLFASGDQTATGLLTSLQNQLTSINKLQADAGALASAGYSQEFIKNVVDQGPQMGNAMSQAILTATPDTQNQIKQLYSQIQNTSASGLDALAQQMNDGTNFATQQMAAAYAQVTVDLNTSLAANNASLADGIAKAQTALNNAITSAQNTANLAMQKAQQTLTDALASSKQQYDKQIQSISDSTMSKLDALQTKIAATAMAITALGGTPVAGSYTPYAADQAASLNYGPDASVSMPAQTANANPLMPNNAPAGSGATTNVTIYGYNLLDPVATGQQVIAQVTNGTTQGVSPATAMGVAAKLAAMGM